MIRVNLNLYPRDGYYFKDSDGTVLRGQNWRQVAKKVVEYRKLAKLPPGNPDVEIAEQACARQPNLCHNVTKVVPINKALSLKSRVLKWLTQFRNLANSPQKLEYVTESEAKSRAEVCARCPMNVPLGPSSCSACKQAVTELRKGIIGPRKVDGRLNACNILGVDLSTAMHLDEIRLDNGDLPAHCWRKKSV